MTQEEHNLLVENNIMLKQILAYISSKDTPQQDIKEFILNVIANSLTTRN